MAEHLTASALTEIAAAADIAALEAVRVAWLGKKGKITEQLRALGQASPEERKRLGAALNETKAAIEQAVEARREALEARALEQKLALERIDVTLPARPEPCGAIHPVSQVTLEITAIFADLGFAVAEGPEIEDDGHNFTALNIPESHPARQMHDTFYLKPSPTGRGLGEGPHPVPLPKGEGVLLRTHTSPVQIRTMRSGKPPFRFIAPGATYRCDSDQTHTPMFHQVEGVVIDKHIHFGHLKGCIVAFLRAFFETPDVPVRFRPSFFPFTEPSAEVDIGCDRGGGKIAIGAGGGWLEVMGCGMVHPNVLKNCGIDPAQWQGFAFGMGVERLAMLKYGIPDLRTFFESDLRWLRHYGFDPLSPPNLAAGLS